MRSTVLLPAVLTIMFVVASPLAVAEDAINYQKIADEIGWGWQPAMSDPLGCIRECGGKYDIALLSKKDDRSSLYITILLEGRKIYAWRGHRHSVFQVVGDSLYYAKFHPSSSGGRIVAVDLKTGKELWESPLQGIEVLRHSIYRTLLNLTANNSVVHVYGNESAGRYYEIKDAKTGKTVGHKVFPKGDRSIPMKDLFAPRKNRLKPPYY